MPAQNRYDAECGAEAAWKMASRKAAPCLAPHVLGLYGYRERSAGPLQRRELPAAQVVIILEIGTPIRVYDAGQQERWQQYPGGFVAGLDDRYSLTQFCGEQRGIQLNLTPIAARRLFGIPLTELTGRITHWGDALPRARTLAQRLGECRDWDSRFDMIERLLCEQAGTASAQERVVDWAYQRIVASGGGVDIRSLTREAGYSHKHLVALFHDRVGIAPKRLARLVRFSRLADALRRGAAPNARLAATLGFADQSHLVREARGFSGLTPTALAQSLVAGS